MTGQAFQSPIFDELSRASTRLIAEDEFGALADRVALELPRFVEKIRRIGEPGEQKASAAA